MIENEHSLNENDSGTDFDFYLYFEYESGMTVGRYKNASLGQVQWLVLPTHWPVMFSH